MKHRLARFAAAYVAVEVERETERLRAAAELVGVSIETAGEYLRHGYVRELVEDLLHEAVDAAKLTKAKHAIRLHEVADKAQEAGDFAPAVSALKVSAQVLGHIREGGATVNVSTGARIVLPGRDELDRALDRGEGGSDLLALGQGVQALGVACDQSATANDEATADSAEG